MLNNETNVVIRVNAYLIYYSGYRWQLFIIILTARGHSSRDQQDQAQLPSIYLKWKGGQSSTKLLRQQVSYGKRIAIITVNRHILRLYKCRGGRLEECGTISN